MHAEVARLAVSNEQRQPLRPRLLPRLLARQRWQRRCSLLRRRLPLQRPRDAQRRLLGSNEAAQVHIGATASHKRLVGLGTAGTFEVHTEEARGVVGHEQRQPLRPRLLPRLLARQRRHRPLHRRPPLRRSRNAQRRLLCGGEVAQVQELATAAHPCRVGLRLTGPVVVHAVVARRVLGHEQQRSLAHHRRVFHRRCCSRCRLQNEIISTESASGTCGSAAALL